MLLLYCLLDTSGTRGLCKKEKLLFQSPWTWTQDNNTFIFLFFYRFMWFMIKVTFGEHDRCNDSTKPEFRSVFTRIACELGSVNIHKFKCINLLQKQEFSTSTLVWEIREYMSEYMYVYKYNLCKIYHHNLDNDLSPPLIRLIIIMFQIRPKSDYRQFQFPEFRQWHSTFEIERPGSNYGHN